MRRLLVLLLLCVCCNLAAQTALTYTSVVVFGDSLSDTGDLYTTAGRLYPTPLTGNYTTARFTNGADTVPPARKYFGVWHEQLSGLLPSVPVSQSFLLSSGGNHAFGDARTVDGLTPATRSGVTINIRNMGQQVTDYLAVAKPNNTTLYIVFGGSNDFLQDPATSATDAATRITALIQRLVAAGAVNFLVPNLPPLGDATSQLGADSVTFNAILAGQLAALQSAYSKTGTPFHLVQVDIFSLYGRLLTNPTAYGFTNLTSPAQTAGPTVNPDTYLTWDGLHPTTAGHFWIAQAACSAMTMSSATLTASGNTLTATVSNSGTLGLPVATATPTGAVNFYSSTLNGTTYTYTSLGSGTLNAQGAATLTNIPAGTYTVTAVYQGDTNFPVGCRTPSIAFTSTTVPSFTLSLTNNPATANAGASVQTQVTVVAAGGFNKTVTIACGTLPQYMTCSIPSPTVAAGSSTTINFETSTTVAMERDNPGPWRNAPQLFLALTPLVMLLSRRRRTLTRRLLLVALFTLAAATGLSGCGSHNHTRTTPVGTYTIPITGTATDGTTSTSNFSLTVK